jgi:hypothetical protein
MIRRILSISLSLFLGLGTCATAFSVAELLEQAIYQEETVGDLDAAIEIYDDIVAAADAGRPHVAQALYRLGQCQLKLGREREATVTFARLVEQYGDQAEWVAKARAHLPDEPDAGLEILPAPWEDGELLRYAVRSQKGDWLGDLTYSTRAVEVEGKPAWQVESYMALPKAEIAKYVRIDADRDSFVPLRHSFYHSQLGSLEATYVDGERRLMMNKPGEPAEPFNQKLATVTYENEQILPLIRRLPLAPGYVATFSATGRPGLAVTMSATVVGVETVETPAGTFEAFKVEVGVPPFIETQWFSTDARRLVVKVTNPEIEVLLNEITRLPEGAHPFEEPRTGISLTVPAGWDVQRSSFRFGEHEYFLLIFPPAMKAKAAGVAQRRGGPTTVREFAETDLEIYRSRRSSYRVDDSSWNELKVAGAPAVELMASLRAENESLLEYRIYIEGPSNWYWFIYRARPDVFDSFKEEFDALVQSLEFE